ncbi:transposase [Actinomadura coerulea]|uniref:transposase n=1 Tax=Actinomadura coerulea TaxID=46159 RepID=UPI00343471C5
MVRTGCSWRQLPAGFPPWQTVYWYFVWWEQQRITLQMLDALRRQVRQSEGRDADPSAGIINSQSVKAADTIGRDTRGYDAGKKVAGRKRFIVTDTLSLLITVTVCAASVQGRDGAKGRLLRLYLTSPTCRFVFADAWSPGPQAPCAPPSRSSANPQTRRGSPCYPDGGRSNGRWPG